MASSSLPITKDGHFLAWRLVKDDYWDIYTGTTFHCVSGAVLQMPRGACNPNPEETCSAGIHVAAFGYLDSYGFNDSGRRCMLTKVILPGQLSRRDLRRMRGMFGTSPERHDHRLPGAWLPQGCH
jgi:hypothetical protein